LYDFTSKNGEMMMSLLETKMRIISGNKDGNKDDAIAKLKQIFYEHSNIMPPKNTPIGEFFQIPHP